MQVLVFELGSQDYGLPTRHIVRVLPKLALTRLAPAADFIAGVMNFHGAPVPVIDLARVSSMAGAAGQAIPSSGARQISFDTRIILVDHVQPSGQKHLLGLLAEHVSGVRQIDVSSVTGSGVRDPNAPFLGQVVATQPRLLQLIELAQLVPPHVCEWLFDTAAAVAEPHKATLPSARAGGSAGGSESPEIAPR